MKNFFYLFFFLLQLNLFCQQQIVDTTNYSFINYNNNVIINGNKYLNTFFNKLNLLENNKLKKVTIFHFGDSHVAGLSFPNRLEYHFQLNFGNLGRNVITEIPKTSKHIMYNKNIKRKTYRTKIRKRSSNSEEFDFNYYSIDIDTLYVPDSLEIDTDTTWLKLLPTAKSGIYFNIYGNVGKSFSFFTTSSSFINQLELINTDLAIITLGTNDAYGPLFDSLSFYNSANSVIQLVKNSNPSVNIILTIPAESYTSKKYPNPNIITVRNTLIKLCNDEKICAWDFYNIMASEDKMNQWMYNGLAANDRIHFTKVGYSLMADLLYVAIMKDYESYLKKTNNN